MRPAAREWILARTRTIVRAQLPPLEEWIATHPYFRYEAPDAGAIAYIEYDLPIGSTELVDRIREEQSVLLVSGDMFGLDAGLRFGFGYDIEHTLKGLARVDEVLAALSP
jgi:aspartate/methionine/tyrosine aminotransferase